MSRILFGVLAGIIVVLIFVPLEAVSEQNKSDESQLVKEEAEEDTLEAGEKVDDWVMELEPAEIDMGKKATTQTVSMPNGQQVHYTVDGMKVLDTISATRLNESVASSVAISAGTIGYSVGGAKDIDNFRDNIANNYLPRASSITYEGLFYDYYFDTGREESADEEMFSPSYSIANISNQRKEENELWLSVGLNSNIKESDFSRKKLNLVVVLDVSGSMSSSFTDYYYDGSGQKENDGRSKLTIACETICSMVEHLNPGDRFGMVVFESNAYLAKPLNLVGKTNMDKIKQHIMELRTMGGTNMYAGMVAGTKLFDQYLENNLQYKYLIRQEGFPV